MGPRPLRCLVSGVGEAHGQTVVATQMCSPFSEPRGQECRCQCPVLMAEPRQAGPPMT